LKKVSLQKIVETGFAQGVHSIFLFPGFPPLGNKKGIVKLGDVVLSDDDVRRILRATTTDWLYARFLKEKELDYSYDINGGNRFRVNAFFKRNNLSLVIRPIPANIPEFESLGLPDSLKDFTTYESGLVLITGPTGSGKSTTLASLVDIINREKACHILTIEDPIEFTFQPKKALISQREIGRDTLSVSEALRRALREDPDVIVVHEIRDKETMRAALELAETGHLVFSTLHSIHVSQAVYRIIDFFRDDEKDKIRLLISQVLKGVVSQRLIQRADGKGFVCAVELMKVNPAISTLIREDKIHQIFSTINLSKAEGMISMDDALLNLYRKGFIDMPVVISYSSGEKSFIEKVAKEAPTTQDALSGKMILDVERKLISYEADFSGGNLSFFDSSGLLLDTPIGLLYRDTGVSKEGFNFLSDYTILNGKKESFPLRALFKLSYKILNVKMEKKVYTMKLRIVVSDKESIEIPPVPLELVKDNEWHTITLPIPKHYVQKEVKYYMILFDNNIREIAFNNINFI